MTVKELIQQLKQANPEAEVWLNIYLEDEREEFTIDDIFQSEAVDCSAAHPFKVYIGNNKCEL